jgi:Spy/CpxP family protein refolding chaperone
MKRRLTILAAMVALGAAIILAQTSATAQNAAGKANGVRDQVRKRLVNALDLTADQKQRAKIIMQGARQTAQPLTQQLKQDREALTAAIQAGDSARIQQLSTDMGSLRGHVLAIRSDAMSKFYAMLTPDQKAKAAEFQQRARQVLGRQAGE